MPHPRLLDAALTTTKRLFTWMNIERRPLLIHKYNFHELPCYESGDVAL
jgi:hypothetical protein